MVDNALALGIEHAALNVNLTQLIDPSDSRRSLHWEYDGRQYAFSRRTVAGLDAQVKPLSDRGVVVYLILLPYASGDPERDRLMLHPNYARGQKNAGPIGMFNTESPESAAWLSATIEFLADRYSGQGEHGRVWGYIAGNEVNSHWFWANMGLASQEKVVDAYERGVRAIHTAVRKASPAARVYISLEHCWGERYAGGSEKQCLPGRDFLDAFADKVRERGDFNWHIAYHPYPEPLTDCRFWRDTRHSRQAEDSPVVSFRNLEVLMQHLGRSDLLYNGKPRRVILSEQGFHCSDRPDGELEQAAAYALAYKKVDRIDGIDAFILHRHVDHAGEGGLRLGLWTNKPGTVATPDRKRLMYEMFQAAGTPDEPKTFERVLPVFGGAGWDEVLTKMAEGKPLP